MNLGPHRLTVHWAHKPRAGPAAARACCVLAAVSLLALAAAPAGADNGATGTVALSSTAITSISVSPNTFSYSECVDEQLNGSNITTTLPFPNGACFSSQGAVSITNGDSPSNIEVAATTFAPSDGLGPDWTLCAQTASTQPAGAPLPLCSGHTAGLPGTDQADMWSQPGEFTIVPANGFIGVVGTTAGCDPAWTLGSCAATAGQTETESLAFRGPEGSTDLSPSFSNTVTWIAVSP